MTGAVEAVLLSEKEPCPSSSCAEVDAFSAVETTGATVVGDSVTSFAVDVMVVAGSVEFIVGVSVGDSVSVVEVSKLSPRLGTMRLFGLVEDGESVDVEL